MKHTTTKNKTSDTTHKSTVLIVDDDPIARRLMEALLAEEGYDLAFAANGTDTLTKAAELAPDLILLDVMMPGMDGFEVCRRLRADPLMAEVPIIMVTALADRISRLRGIEAGADDFVSKPLDPAELRARVQTIIRLNRYHLLRERAKFEQLVELSPEGIVIVNGEGLIDLANPAMLRMLGVEREEDIIGEEILTFVTPEQTERCSAYLRDVITGTPETTQIEAQCVRSDGERFLVEINAGRFVWGGEPAAQVIVRDITERKRAEEALRRYAEEQSALYTVASAAATLLDPEEVLSAVLDAVLPALDSDAGWVVLPNPTLDDPPRVVAQRGIPASLLKIETATSLSSCPVCASWLAGNGAQVEPQLIGECPCMSAEARASANLHNHVGIPLSTGDTLLGVMGVAWRTPRPYSESDHALLMTIGRQVGLALRNAQLYQAARQVDRLRVLNELDQALAATLDPEKMAEVTLRQIAAALDTSMGASFVLPPQADAHPERMFTLEQGWIEIATSEADTQRIRAFLRRLQDNREVVPLSGGEPAAISGQYDLDKRWPADGLLVPVWGDEELVAVLSLGGRPADRPFEEEDLALARTAASRAGQAIRNARLYQASQQQSARLATLNAISAAAVSSLELDTVLHQILELTCRAMDATAGSVLVSDPDAEGLVFVVTLTDERSGLRGQRLTMGQGIAGWVAQHGQPIYVNDVRHDPRFHDSVDTAIGFETRSVCCAPLKHLGKVAGVIEVVNKRTEGKESNFTDDDLSLLEAVSSIAAAALENARLYTTTLARANELALLNEIGLALTSTLDYSTVVHAALSQAQRLFQAEYVSLLQPDPQTGELCFAQVLVEGTPVEISTRLPRRKGIAGWVLEQHQPVLIEDAQNDPRFLDWAYQYVGRRARALMAVPLLLARGRIVGVIEVASSEPAIYTRNELRILQALASTLAVALENASLYDELKTLLREWEDAQTQLIHAEKMTALGRLAASIAHEINNPLQAVQTYLTLTQEELDSDRRRERMKRYLDTVGSEIERISEIVRRMRDFYRPAREGLQLTHLHAVLESVLELTNKQLQHSNVTVERAWAEHLPEIQANPDHLKQVFLNLVLNGIDAMPEGGTLHIRTALDQIEADDDQLPRPAVRIEFNDTGEGIPPEVLPHLFEPFFTTKKSGTGLGLSISYGIIQSHNGRITVESHVGLGTTFTILLPVEQALGD